MRLIDADELIEHVWRDRLDSRERIADLVKSMPSEEPEIIRCKDCKFSIDEPISDGRYWCHIHRAYMRYCSEAERKDNE